MTPEDLETRTNARSEDGTLLVDQDGGHLTLRFFGSESAYTHTGDL